MRSPAEETPTWMPDRVKSAIREHCADPEAIELTLTLGLVARKNWEEGSDDPLDHYRDLLRADPSDGDGDALLSDDAVDAVLAAAREALDD